MASQRFCQDCIQKHDCQRIYGQLGDSPGESVALKVIFAFLLPLIVFIVSLAVSERVLARVIKTEEVQMVISFVLAILVTFICMFVTRALIKRLGLNK
jgi:hypothetical protein